MVDHHNGTRFPCAAILLCSQDTDVAWHSIAPVRPHQPAFVDRFNLRMRDVCRNETLLALLVHARAVLMARQRDKNEARPQASFGGRPDANYDAVARASEVLRGAFRLSVLWTNADGR